MGSEFGGEPGMNGPGSTGSVIGYHPVPTHLIQQNIDFVLRWLNANVLATPLETFPNSIVETHGKQLFEILTFFTGQQTFPFQANLPPTSKRTTRIQSIYKQYDTLLRSLKQEGGLLNNIRPEYLFSY